MASSTAWHRTLRQDGTSTVRSATTAHALPKRAPLRKKGGDSECLKMFARSKAASRAAALLRWPESRKTYRGFNERIRELYVDHQ
eukprot:797536-Pleurochrysis_carterae.AAC.6